MIETSLIKQIMDANLTGGTPIILVNRDNNGEPERIIGGFITGMNPGWITLSYENPASSSFGRCNFTSGNRNYNLSKFNEFYKKTPKNITSSENLVRTNLVGRLDAAIGNFIVLTDRGVNKLAGFVSEISPDRVKLQHDHPLYEISVNSTTIQESSSGKRIYALSCFDSYEILNLTNSSPAKEDRDAP